MSKLLNAGRFMVVSLLGGLAALGGARGRRNELRGFLLGLGEDALLRGERLGALVSLDARLGVEERCARGARGLDVAVERSPGEVGLADLEELPCVVLDLLLDRGEAGLEGARLGELDRVVGVLDRRLDLEL